MQALPTRTNEKGSSDTMQELSRRNEHFTDSVIRRMTRISIDCGAINLAQGFPDFDPPKAMTDRLEEVSRLGPHQYPITMGAPNFRQALSRKRRWWTPFLPSRIRATRS